MTEEKKRVAREFYIMSPTLEQEFNGAKQYVRMCIEIPHFRSNFSGEYFIAIDKTAYQQALEQIAKLEESFNSILSAKKSGCVEYKNCECWWQIADQALAELKKWRGKNG